MPARELTSQEIANLRYIETVGLKPGAYWVPDFLIVGPQRTGSTWLYNNLVFHPEVFIPEAKELYFFNNLQDRNPVDGFQSARLEWYSRQFSPGLRRRLREGLKTLWEQKSWEAARFALRSCRPPGPTRGEATASYAALEPELIREVTTLNPEVRVVMFLRHPVQRAWSHAKKRLLKRERRSYNDLNFDDFVRVYTDAFHVRCGQYIRNIANWKSAVGESRFFLGLFDDIRTRPQELLREVFRFLQVTDSEAHVPRSLVSQRINPTEDRDVPAEHVAFLSNLFRDEIVELNREFQLGW